jgi:hypothetical protein
MYCIGGADIDAVTSYKKRAHLIIFSDRLPQPLLAMSDTLRVISVGAKRDDSTPALQPHANKRNPLVYSHIEEEED